MEHRNKPYLEKQIGNWYTPKPDNDEQAVLAEALDACRKLCEKTDIHYLQENLLSSILYGRKELTYVDLHGLDLSHSNFFNVICSRKSCFGKVGTNFSGAVLHEDCFHPQNHQDNSYDFTVSSAASGVKLVFMLGNVGTTENMAHTISIDDISLYKVS